MNTTLKELITSFTKSIDLYNYLLKNHHRRTAIAAYHIGNAYGLSKQELSDLVIAAALHDIGALTVIERDQLIKMDTENPYPHSRLGYYMLESFQPFHEIARIIYYHHWPYEQEGEAPKQLGAVPIQSYILHVADRVDILNDVNAAALSMKESIPAIIRSYSGKLFHPGVVEAFEQVAVKDSFWLDISNLDMDSVLNAAISDELEIELTVELLEQFAFTISKIIDTRSKFTISHSFGVSAVAYHIAALLGYPEEKCRRIRIAGLLHDMGKIAVPTEIIEKNGPLTREERTDIQTHAYFTSLILKDIDVLGEIRDWASNHHENHDGSGYPKNLIDSRITEEMDIISYADIYTALSENRPYREGLTAEEILSIMQSQFVMKHGNAVYDIIAHHVDTIDRICKESIREGVNRYDKFEEFVRLQQA